MNLPTQKLLNHAKLIQKISATKKTSFSILYEIAMLMHQIIRYGFEQLAGEGSGTMALYDANHNQSLERLSFIQKGIDEARWKGWIKGPIEVWFKDKTCIKMN